MIEILSYQKRYLNLKSEFEFKVLIKNFSGSIKANKLKAEDFKAELLCNFRFLINCWCITKIASKDYKWC